MVACREDHPCDHSPGRCIGSPFCYCYGCEQTSREEEEFELWNNRAFDAYNGPKILEMTQEMSDAHQYALGAFHHLVEGCLAAKEGQWVCRQCSDEAQPQHECVPDASLRRLRKIDTVSIQAALPEGVGMNSLHRRAETHHDGVPGFRNLNIDYFPSAANSHHARYDCSKGFMFSNDVRLLAALDLRFRNLHSLTLTGHGEHLLKWLDYKPFGEISPALSSLKVLRFTNCSLTSEPASLWIRQQNVYMYFINLSTTEAILENFPDGYSARLDHASGLLTLQCGTD
jgi:hypothetical protein